MSKEIEKPQEGGRECSMTVCVGTQGAGKTYYNMHLIYLYCQDKIKNKVKGRKCLILDSNGEFADSQWKRNGIPDFTSPAIALKDIRAFANPKYPVECRRVDMKHLLISEKLEVLTYAINNFKDGLLLAEDINGYVLNLTFLEEIIGRMVSLRHRGLDTILSFQGLRAINPVIYRNTRWVRYHHQLDNASTVKDKVNNYQLFKLAQIITNNRYENGDIRFRIFIHHFGNKLEGDFTREEFELACKQYLNIDKTEVKEYMDMHEVGKDEAVKAQIGVLSKRYLVQPEKKEKKQKQLPPVNPDQKLLE